MLRFVIAIFRVYILLLLCILKLCRFIMHDVSYFHFRRIWYITYGNECISLNFSFSCRMKFSKRKIQIFTYTLEFQATFREESGGKWRALPCYVDIILNVNGVRTRRDRRGSNRWEVTDRWRHLKVGMIHVERGLEMKQVA